MLPTIYFLLTERVHMLDLSGPLQVFQEASGYGIKYEFQYLSINSRLTTSSGLEFSNLKKYDRFEPTQADIICVPGGNYSTSDHHDLTIMFDWLRTAHQKKTTICSICSGAFILAQSGLLDGRPCTTHWALTDQLQKKYPRVIVKKDILFTKDENIYTSAGFTTGVDLALHLVEERHGGEFAAKLARELVVYVRRNGADEQRSIYLQHRSHQDEKVHTVQDWIIQHIDKKVNIEALAEMVHTSARNLSRIFKEKSGITITAYRNKVRLEKAKILRQNSDFKLEHIAKLCGYTNGRQLRTLLKAHST